MLVDSSEDYILVYFKNSFLGMWINSYVCELHMKDSCLSTSGLYRNWSKRKDIYFFSLNFRQTERRV